MLVPDIRVPVSLAVTQGRMELPDSSTHTGTADSLSQHHDRGLMLDALVSIYS
ncbi:MAG TPA: hypothetical protein VNE41_02060 [Chitinophagaceae bacterium]|nr:hypothetical protein [Chitinophagaceae bacterium]